MGRREIKLIQLQAVSLYDQIHAQVKSEIKEKDIPRK